jgi:YD repeat-containing protein
MLGHSTRGPRIEIVDTLRLDGSNFTTTLDPSAATVHLNSLGAHAQSTFPTPADVKKILARVTRPAAYTPIDMSLGVSWAVVSGAEEGAELFWDSIQSLFVSSYTLSRNVGRALIPVAANKPFTVVGVDASTGLQAFTKVYAGFAPGDPAGAVVLDPANDNDAGPIPVFASPARIEIVDVPPVGVVLTSVRNLKITFENGFATIAAGTPAPAAKTTVDVFNPTRGAFRHIADINAAEASIPAQTGDRLIITISEHDVDSDSTVSISFNKRMYLGGASDEAGITQFLKTLITVQTDDEDQPSQQPADITEQVKFNADSDAHRITLKLGGALQLGKRYTIVLKSTLADASGTDNAAGLKLGQSRVNGQVRGGLGADLKLTFTVRKPRGPLATNTLIPGSVIHDMSLNGNLALVAAGNGGVQAFDISDPAKLDGMEPPLSAFINCTWDGGRQTFDPCGFGYWAVASDHHGRIITTGMGGALGSLKTFRVADFINPSTQDNIPPLPRYVPLDKQVGGTPISWTPGINTNMPLGSEILLGDKPEAIPRRVQILLQDDEVKLSRTALIAKYQGSKTDLSNGYQKLTLKITPDQPSYQWQTITIENRTLKLRWSVDVPKNSGGKSLAGIIAGPNDDLYVIVNRTTYAVVSLFGFGVGVYDVNAIESNDRPVDSGYKPVAEIVALTNGNSDEAADPLTVHQCNQSSLAASGLPCPINDLTYNPEALLRTGTASGGASSQVSSIQLFALEQRHGLFDGVVTPPAAAADDKVTPGTIDVNSVGLSLTSPYPATSGGWDSFDQPRLRTLRNMYRTIGGIDAKDVRPVGRHTSIAYYARPPSAGSRTTTPDEYALIASFQYGVIVVKLGDEPMGWPSVVDVIWTPAGAASVRVMPRGDMAVVVDGAGRVLLVDLRQIDESSKVPPLTTCSSAKCTDPLFPTATASLKKQAPPLPPDADWTEAGIDDPRIIWKSQPHLVHGTLAPLVDPDTGIVFTGDVSATSQAEINTIAATDPRIRFMVNTGDQSAYRETGALVPLGIAPPSNVTLTGPDASLAAFRLELWLPGSIAESLTNSNQELRLALESERVLNAPSEQTVAPLPPSHLRHATIDGKADARIVNDPTLSKFKLDRLVPYDANDAEMKSIRYQEGFNHFTSQWVVSIADPRASIDYKMNEWSALSAGDKAKLGCYACNRPAFLDPAKTPGLTNVYELLTTGRFVSARPEVCATGTSNCTAGASIFTGTRYAYLGAANRLHGRISTVMVDTVRSTSVLTAADAPPIAGGALQATTFVHSGEVMTSSVDLDAGGRAGWNVAFDRTYRSRTMLSSAIGSGWESSLFVRLRPLPNGDVEYRDGSGEVWRFIRNGNGYNAPVALSLELDATSSGWRIFDQKRRITAFDSLGRIVSESDQFFDNASGGNVINYFYDGSGRLGSVVDPVGRVSKLSYFDDCANVTDCFPGMLREIVDWRNRKVGFHYDGKGNLIAVDKPEAKNGGALFQFDHSGSNRPVVHYTYKSAGSSMQDFIDLASNLESIREPADTAPRVTFRYDDTGAKRDLIRAQEWGTDDRSSATFDFNVASILVPPSSTTVTDTRGQKRIYTFSSGLPADYNIDRPHLRDVTEENVASWSGSAFGVLPATVSKNDASHFAIGSRKTTFGYENGRLKTISTDGGASTTIGYEDVASGDIGKMVHQVDSAGGLGSSQQITNHTDDGLAFVKSTKADGTDELQTPEARHDFLTTTAVDAGVTRIAEHLPSGLPHVMTSTGDGPGSKQRVEYYDVGDGNLFKRSMPSDVVAGEDNDGVKSHIDYPNADQTIEHGPRGVDSTTDSDELGRPIHTKSSGNDLAPEEWFGYDANGRLARHRHLQGAKIVEDRYEYDLADRLTKRSIYDGETEIESTKTDYFVAQANTINTYLPGGGTIANTIDNLGRVTRSETKPNHPNATSIVSSTLYDIEDNPAFLSDEKMASAMAYDSAHRVRQSLTSDGTKTVLTLDGWNRTRSATTTNGSQTLATYTADFIGPQLQHVEENARRQDFTWDGAGRTNSVVMTGAEQPRASQTVYDQAGRVVSSTFGEGTVGPFARATSTSPRSFAIARESSKVENNYGGANTELPVTTTSTEDGAHKQTWTLDLDTLGQTTHAGIAGKDFSFDHHFDESGNVTSSKTPARRGETTYDYDARSFATAEHLPGPSQPTNVYAPDANGVLKQYTDPTGEPTKVTNDGIGRPVKREYFDGTFEEIHYDRTRVDFTRDRQKREQHFAYDDGGRLSEVKNASGVVLDHIDYENGRVIRWKTPDASTEFSDFDVDNHPQQITQHRLDANGNEIDTYTITHSWNAAGELMRTDLPSYQGMNAGTRWVNRLEYTHDANGNVESILRNGAAFMNAQFRSAARPIHRDLTLANGVTLGRAYDYDDAAGSVGRLSGMRVTVNGTVVAGSSLLFEGLQRKREQLLGVSDGARFTTWSYDDRGRVTGSVVATVDPSAVPLLGIPGASIVKLTDADFRTDLDRTIAKTTDTPSTITTESPRKGHKVGTITHGANTESILYQGSGGEEVSVRTDDGRYHYDFDEKEHLRSITERLIPNGTQSRLIRVRYFYDAFDRIVGRRVEVAPVTPGRPPLESDWTLAPSNVVANQPLPAATTFVWDPVADNLAAIFVEGASRNGTTLPNGGLIRQFIHGGMGMDDPIEVVTPAARLFPIFDEPGPGGLRAVISETGQLLARNVTADPYGEEQLAIPAPAIDEVKLTATKDTSGALSSVKITMHATEPLDATTIAAGIRLAAVSAAGAVVRISTVPPTQPDAYTVAWTLPLSEWTALTTANNATAISVAATSSLRSTTYGLQIPILPATADMQSTGTVFSSAALPIEIREPITAIQQLVHGYRYRHTIHHRHPIRTRLKHRQLCRIAHPFPVPSSPVC